VRTAPPVTFASHPRAHPDTIGELAALGPFFAADVHGAGDVPPSPWRPVRDLADDPGVLDERVTRVRSALARGEPPDTVALRVAASVTQLGLVARLIAPTVATAALGAGMDPSDSWWQDQLGGPYPLSVTLRDRPCDDVVAGVIESITTATISAYGVPPRTAWGNAASATNSAAQMIARSRPDLASAACDAADAILADPRIEGGRLRSGPSFQRKSCCLIYQLNRESPALCGDCVLQRR
jgi:FhuF 2Fe-2S C-terminal domain